MSDETKRIIWWVLGIALFMVFYLILLGIVWIVKGPASVDYMLGITGYVVIGLIIFAAVMLLRIYDARIYHMATRNYIELQAADDRGEIARQAMKNIGEFENRVIKSALQLNQQMGKASTTHRIVQDNEPKFDLSAWMQQAPQLETKGEYYELD